jgi:hypothetical protein
MKISIQHVDPDAKSQTRLTDMTATEDIPENIYLFSFLLWAEQKTPKEN